MKSNTDNMPIADAAGERAGGGMGSQLKLILRNVVRQRSRNLLLGALIVFASLVIVYFSQFLQGVAHNFSRNLIVLATGDLYVASQAKSALDRNIFDREYEYFHVPKTALDVLEKHPSVRDVDRRMEFLARVATEIDSVPFYVMAVELEREPDLARNFEISEGRMFKSGAYEVVVPVEFARRNHVKVGDTIRLLTNSVDKKVNLIDYIVVGTFSTMSLSAWFDNYIYLDMQVARVLVDDAAAVTRLNVHLVDGADAAPVIDDLREGLHGAKDSNGEPLEVTHWTDGAEMFAELTAAMQLSYMIVIVIVTIMIGSSLALATMLNILERTKEIATLGALGATPGRVVRLLVGENMTLALVASVAGIGLAMVLFSITASIGIPIANKELSGFLGSSHFYPAFSPSGVIAGLAVPLAVAFFASVFFAIRASRLSIAEAMADR